MNLSIEQNVTGSDIIQWKSRYKYSPNLELLVNQFDNDTPGKSNDPENISSSKYYYIDKRHNIKIPRKNKSLSLFHINACSFNKNVDELKHLLSCTKEI